MGHAWQVVHPPTMTVYNFCSCDICTPLALSIKGVRVVKTSLNYGFLLPHKLQMKMELYCSEPPYKAAFTPMCYNLPAPQVQCIGPATFLGLFLAIDFFFNILQVGAHSGSAPNLQDTIEVYG